VKLAKAGFGAVKTAYDYVPLVRDAKAAGLITTCHTGGSSIPGSGAITGDHLLAMRPHVSFHINGGPTAMPDAISSASSRRARSRCRSAPPAICARRCCARGSPKARRLRPLHHRHRHPDRLRRHAARHALHDRALREPDRHAAGALHLRGDRQQRASTGLDSAASSRAGKAADIVLARCARRRHAKTALAAIKHGDIAAIGAVITAGVPRFVGRSRNTHVIHGAAKVWSLL
jgi:enamidase